ncbi:cilia- and flagella-associated protein 45-like [Poecile atricapillus]|uniref:cilia- and flagella-associated protein 45-like n=1 Tax=Poecile atricapillus TaxID=48891 RepID=UPI00273973C9|nr:cilia- and flagella-associated protein 45-like [Poecile atricapillus]
MGVAKSRGRGGGVSGDSPTTPEGRGSLVFVWGHLKGVCARRAPHRVTQLGQAPPLSAGAPPLPPEPRPQFPARSGTLCEKLGRCRGNSLSRHIATAASGTLPVPGERDSPGSAGSGSAMAAATAATGSRSLRAGGSSRGSLLARRLQLSPPGLQSVTGSSSAVVISQDVPKHPQEILSFKPKLKTIQVITKDVIRELVVPQEKAEACLIIGEKEYERIKESARAPSEEERRDRLKSLKARQDAAFEALQKAKSEEQRKAELQDEREWRRDVQEELQQEKQQLLQRAARMRLEQEEEIRALNTLFLEAKCNMIWDKQLLEKRTIRKELADEEKRLDKMMLLEWEKGSEVQEELECQRKRELLRARHDIAKQMEQNAEERALREEELYQEGQRHLERLEQMKREDREAWQQKQERRKQIHAEIKQFNEESQRLQEEQRKRERLEEERALEQQRQKDERDAALEAEKERLRLEKEKELARLRVTQERAQDWLAERDALRAKRNQEAAEREWRRQELQKARKKAELEQQLRQERLQQVAQKEEYVAMQVEQDRQEFQRVLRSRSSSSSGSGSGRL